jgi:hypothetical protein
MDCLSSSLILSLVIIMLDPCVIGVLESYAYKEWLSKGYFTTSTSLISSGLCAGKVPNFCRRQLKERM